MKRPHKFIEDLDSAIDCFFPVLQDLQIKEDIKNPPISVCLSCFPNLRDIDSIKEWEIA